jgi:hypothetical protein
MYLIRFFFFSLHYCIYIIIFLAVYRSRSK